MQFDDMKKNQALKGHKSYDNIVIVKADKGCNYG